MAFSKDNMGKGTSKKKKSTIAKNDNTVHNFPPPTNSSSTTTSSTTTFNITKIARIFILIICILSFYYSLSVSSRYSIILAEYSNHYYDMPLPSTKRTQQLLSLSLSSTSMKSKSNANKMKTTTPTTTTITTTTTMPNNNTTPTETETEYNPYTLALVYPTGLFGGYRNQAMRFIGFLKLALLDNTSGSDPIDQLLLPTIVWSTRYHLHKEENEENTINPAVTFWPVPFDELFDVNHWNTFHYIRPTTTNSTNSSSSSSSNTDRISLPLLVSSIDDNEENEEEDGNNKQQTVCWTSNPNSLKKAIENHATYQHNLIPNTTIFRQSWVPPLTYRMLFHSDRSYFLEPLYEKVIDFLVGNGAKRFHRVDHRSLVENCTSPYAYGSGMILWNAYLGMEKRSPSILPAAASRVTTTSVPTTTSNSTTAVTAEGQRRRLNGDATKIDNSDDSIRSIETNSNHIQQQQQRRLKGKLRQQRKQRGGDKPPKDDAMSQQTTKLVKTIEEALIPAKQWRELAKQCVEHHLTVPNSTLSQQQQPRKSNNGSNSLDAQFGYIALHARIEPEMLAHTCGKGMERNLTTILNLVEELAIDYNTKKKNNNNNNNSNNQPHRQLLEGVFVAVGRDEMQGYEKYATRDDGNIKKMALYNWNVLNTRSISYNEQGHQLFTSTASTSTSTSTSMQYQQHQQQQHEEDSSSLLPIFECGEGWVEYGFYKNEQRQHELLSTSSSSTSISSSLTLPLPNNYYGDILPSMINFWLAVNADVFVGVMKSSWSNDVWTTRYYQGKGMYNYQYTHDTGIVPVENNGLPPPHKNCS